MCVLTGVCARLLGLLCCSFQHLFICVTTLQLLDNNTTIITVSTQQTCHFVDLSFGTPSPPSKCGVSVWLVMSLNLKSKNEIHPWLAGGCWCWPELEDSALQIATPSHVTPPCRIQTPDLWFDVT